MKPRTVTATAACLLIALALAFASAGPAWAPQIPGATIDLSVTTAQADTGGASANPLGSDLPASPSAATAETASTITLPQPAGAVSGNANSAIDSRILQIQYSYNLTLLSIVIAAVIIAAFCLMYAIGRASGEFSRHYIVIVVVVAAIFLLVMGYTEQQVAPAFGLLGTILGYMFGRAAVGADAPAQATRQPPPPAPESPTQPAPPVASAATYRRDRPASLDEMDTP